MLIVGCFFVLQPFLTALVWAAILCTTTWPLYLRLQCAPRRSRRARGARDGRAARVADAGAVHRRRRDDRGQRDADGAMGPGDPGNRSAGSACVGRRAAADRADGRGVLDRHGARHRATAPRAARIRRAAAQVRRRRPALRSSARFCKWRCRYSSRGSCSATGTRSSRICRVPRNGSPAIAGLISRRSRRPPCAASCSACSVRRWCRAWSPAIGFWIAGIQARAAARAADVRCVAGTGRSAARMGAGRIVADPDGPDRLGPFRAAVGHAGGVDDRQHHQAADHQPRRATCRSCSCCSACWVARSRSASSASSSGPVLLAVGYALLMEWAASRGQDRAASRRTATTRPRRRAAQRRSNASRPSRARASETRRCLRGSDRRRYRRGAAAARSRDEVARGNGASACTICANTLGVAAITWPPCR